MFDTKPPMAIIMKMLLLLLSISSTACGLAPKDENGYCADPAMEEFSRSKSGQACPADFSNFGTIDEKGHCFYTTTCGDDYQVAGCFYKGVTFCSREFVGHSLGAAFLVQVTDGTK